MLVIAIISVVIVLVPARMVRTLWRLYNGWTFCSMPWQLHLHSPKETAQRNTKAARFIRRVNGYKTRLRAIR